MKFKLSNPADDVGFRQTHLFTETVVALQSQNLIAYEDDDDYIPLHLLDVRKIGAHLVDRRNMESKAGAVWTGYTSALHNVLYFVNDFVTHWVVLDEEGLASFNYFCGLTVNDTRVVHSPAEKLVYLGYNPTSFYQEYPEHANATYTLIIHADDDSAYSADRVLLLCRWVDALNKEGALPMPIKLTLVDPDGVMLVDRNVATVLMAHQQAGLIDIKTPLEAMGQSRYPCGYLRLDSTPVSLWDPVRQLIKVSFDGVPRHIKLFSAPNLQTSDSVTEGRVPMDLFTIMETIINGTPSNQHMMATVKLCFKQMFESDMQLALNNKELDLDN